jgi:glycosyltransferase involved in cell wall biosynthesis
VVFVDHVARMSGGEIALLRLLPALAGHVDVHVVLGEDGPLVARLREAGISVEILELPARLRDVRKGTIQLRGFDARALVHLPPYVLQLRRRLRVLETDIVHTNSLKSALYGGMAARLARVPVVWHVRDRIARDYLPRSAVRLVRLGARLLPTAIVANSQATLATLPPLDRSRVVFGHVVLDGVTAFQRHDGSSDRLTIGVVGRLASWKGQEVFLDAFALAFRGTDVNGRIIGSALFGEEAYAARLERRAETLGIAGQIEFRGFRDDISAELNELDVLVHCSVLPEPFGQVVLEGMAAGLPVVAAAAGGPTELLTDGVDGLLTPPGDVPRLADALRRLHADEALREELGAAAQRRSLEFTPERTAAQLFAIYRGIMSSGSP